MTEQEAKEFLEGRGFIVVKRAVREKYRPRQDTPERKDVVCRGCGRNFLAYVFAKTEKRKKTQDTVKYWYIRYWCNSCIYKRRLVREVLKEQHNDSRRS